MDEVGNISALDEDLQQSEQYMDIEMGVPLARNSSQQSDHNEE
jgi:hypothetical protein